MWKVSDEPKNMVKFVVGRKGFEPSTFRLSVERSTKLSYRPCFYNFFSFCFSNINVVYMESGSANLRHYFFVMHINKQLEPLSYMI